MEELQAQVRRLEAEVDRLRKQAMLADGLLAELLGLLSAHVELEMTFSVGGRQLDREWLARIVKRLEKEFAAAWCVSGTYPSRGGGLSRSPDRHAAVRHRVVVHPLSNAPA